MPLRNLLYIGGGIVGSDVTDNDTSNTTNNSSINADNDEDKTVKDETSGVKVM